MASLAWLGGDGLELSRHNGRTGRIAPPWPSSWGGTTWWPYTLSHCCQSLLDAPTFQERFGHGLAGVRKRAAV
jgi:hypothetical protein